jgi:ABC-type lipoprotein release transport system permease subunit
MISRMFVVAQIALRNLLASKINLLIGALIFGGTLVFVVIGSLLDSLSNAMSKSVIGSVAGHVQIYSSKSKDELSLFGNFGSDSDVAAVTQFPKIQDALMKLPNVKVVVPMGVSGALIQSGNTVDQTLEKLRGLYKGRDGQSNDPDVPKLTKAGYDEQIAATKDHVRQMLHVLQDDADKAKAIADESKLDPEANAALKRALGNEFWDHFEEDPYGSLEFLENKIAPQVSDSNMIFLRYLGTDLDKFQQSFDRMKIVDGAPVPKGQRGFLIAKFVYEEQMKLKTARRLDKIHDQVSAGTRTIATDADFQRYVKECQAQTRDIILQLDSIKTKEMVGRLQKFLKSDEADLNKLLVSLFTLDDSNFETRYKFFYDEIAPMVELYKVRVGDTLTIKAFTRSGYVKSVNMKVYGTFSFEGIEKSPLAGAFSLMDLMSFRDLYGYLTNDNAEELKQIAAETGAKKIDRENAEDELFGAASGSKEVVATATAGVIDENKEMSGTAKKLRMEDLIRRVYTQQEIDSGVVLNAAVILKDGSDKAVAQALKDIAKVSDDDKLELKAVSWQQASGLLGQLIGVFKAMLVFAVLMIFVVAAVIILLAMMTTTMQRTQVFGTLRAIGAQSGFVLNMVLFEAVLLGLVFAAVGLVVGTGIVSALATRGIPAMNDYAYFFFSGPRLLPQLATWNLVGAVILVLLTTTIAALIPALMATRVSPLRAMQAADE